MLSNTLATNCALYAHIRSLFRTFRLHLNASYFAENQYVMACWVPSYDKYIPMTFLTQIIRNSLPVSSLDLSGFKNPIGLLYALSRIQYLTCGLQCHISDLCQEHCTAYSSFRKYFGRAPNLAMQGRDRVLRPSSV
jgi:hypothetical protein